ncbi:MAG: single-stranded DNA-binding protein [Pseudomonadota bacterium]
MKQITIAGNIGKDAQLREHNGNKVAGFPVAVDDGFGQNKRTIWFDCSLWGQRAEKLAGYLTKGSKVAVSGDLSTREHEGKTYLTVRVSEVTLQGGGQQSGQQRQQQDWQAPLGDDPDGIPF